MIHITTPTTYLPERRYILEILFTDFLGLPYTHHLAEGPIESEKRFPRIILQIDDQRLMLPDIFFQIPESKWLQKASLPTQPLQTWVVPNHQTLSLCEKEIPIIYGTAPDDTIYDIPIDIFGSAFFMLTRYEEVAQPEIRDKHDRFPATASLAYQEAFLDRPIINEYLEILWHFIQKAAHSLKRKKRTFQIIPSHDVDSPYLYPFRNPLQMARVCASTLIKKKNPLKSLRDIGHYAEARFKKLTNDPNNNFDFLMKVSEANNIKSHFYFITGKTSDRMCGDYNIEHPFIKELMQNIHNRGHQIGIHPSFNTYSSGEKIKEEFQKLRVICDNLNIQQEIWGGRQHFLKWQAPDTWQYWEDAGLDYDSTLSFADHAGFRCGVCYDYPVFNLHTKKTLKLREYPLIVMECSIIELRYMNLGHTQAALDYMLLLKSRCKLFEGNFTILWHNSFFKYPEDKIIYKNILGNQC